MDIPLNKKQLRHYINTNSKHQIMEKHIPKAVVDAASNYIKTEKKFSIYFMGRYKGKYAYGISCEMDSGIPSVFLYDGKNCKRVANPFAIIDYFEYSNS